MTNGLEGAAGAAAASAASGTRKPKTQIPGDKKRLKLYSDAQTLTGCTSRMLKAAYVTAQE